MPAISFKPGQDLVNGGIARGEALAKDYTAKRYHQPDDEYSPDWDFTGMAQDAELLHALGRDLANSQRLAELERGQRIPRRSRPERRASAARGAMPAAPANAANAAERALEPASIRSCYVPIARSNRRDEMMAS